MDLLAWLTGTWQAGTWKVGAWEAAEQPAAAGGGGAGKRPRKLIRPTWYDPGPLIEPPRIPREDDEALLLFLL